MRRSSARCAILAALLALLTLGPLALGSFAQPLPIEVRLDPPEITVGDRVRAELMLVWNGSEPSMTPQFPDWSEGWGDAEVLEVGPVEAIAGPRRIYRQELVLTAFRTGEVLLPTATVTVHLPGESRVSVATEMARFSVRSLLPEGVEIDPRPADDPVALPGGLNAPDNRR